jgi:hypothetical protein
MKKYKILNYKGWIEAEEMMILEGGQISFYTDKELVAVFPADTAVVLAKDKPREFDFINQEEKLKKRNEHLFTGTEFIKKKRGRPQQEEDGKPSEELSTKLENYLSGKTPDEEKLEGGNYIAGTIEVSDFDHKSVEASDENAEADTLDGAWDWE